MTTTQSPATPSMEPHLSTGPTAVPGRARVASVLSGFLGAVRSMAACFFARIDSIYELTDNAGLEPMARERCQAKVREALGEYVQTLHVQPGHTVSLRYEVRMVTCERCGTSCSSRDTCPWCGREATPGPHLPMIAHLAKAEKTAKRSIRRAEAKRKPAVFRIVKEVR